MVFPATEREEALVITINTNPGLFYPLLDCPCSDDNHRTAAVMKTKAGLQHPGLLHRYEAGNSSDGISGGTAETKALPPF
jgi:hypothetical protein